MNKGPINSAASNNNPYVQAGKRWKWRWWKILTGLLLGLGVLFYFFNLTGFLLRYFLVYETPVQAADVVLVSETGERLEKAILFYEEGLAKNILITKTIPERYKEINAPVSIQFFIHEDLIAAGIPEEHIFCLEGPIRNLLESQIVFRDWIHKHKMRSYICFPKYYSSRFRKILHNAMFPEGDIQLVCLPQYQDGLFRKEFLAIQNTLIQMAFWYWMYSPQLRIGV